jgi:hypothetical protein
MIFNYRMSYYYDTAADVIDPFCRYCSSELELIDATDEDGARGCWHCASCEAKESGAISLSLLEGVELSGTRVVSANWVNFRQGTSPVLNAEQIARIDTSDLAEV